MNENIQKTQTLFGNGKVNVMLEDGTSHDWTVRQIRVREYQRAFALIDDEIGLIALACDVKRPVVESLTPPSYTHVYATLQQVNESGFFIFAARQKERAAETMERLPAAMVERIIASSRPTSSMQSPPIPPPQG